MTSGKIRVCVLDGHQAELASAGLPFSVCLRLQELGLPMSAAQWSTRQTNSGFSVSFFWPSTRGATTVTQLKSRNRRRRRRRRKRVSALQNTDVLPAAKALSPAQEHSQSPVPDTAPNDAHQPSTISSPVATAVHHSPSQLSKGTDSVSSPDVSKSSSDNEISGSEESMPKDTSSRWTVVSPRGKFRGPRVPAPYFRMPSHLWPTEIQKKYLHTTSSTESANQSPISSRTRAKTLIT